MQSKRLHGQIIIEKVRHAMSRHGNTSGELVVRRVAIMLGLLVAGCGCGFALNPALDISQYVHKAWTVRDGFSVGTIFAMAQTPDGYLWLGEIGRAHV